MERARKIVLPVGNRQDGHLGRRQPQGKVAGVMLDQDPDEAFQRSEGRAVDQDRPVRLVVRTDVFQFEPFGEIIIELDRAELPVASDDVLDNEIDFVCPKCGSDVNKWDVRKFVSDLFEILEVA